MIKMGTYLKGIAIFCLAIAPVSLCYDDIDAFMNERQIREVFETEAGSVPIHELVEINLPKRNKRDVPTAGIHFTIRAFGRNIQLWLHPVEKVLFGKNTPIYWARSRSGVPGNIDFLPVPQAMRSLGQLFEDPNHLASLVIGTEDSGRDRVNGQMRKKRLAIKSLPHDVVTEYLRKRRSINDYDSSNSTFHVIYKLDENLEQKNSISHINQTILRERIARSSNQIPNVLYLELLIFIENSMYKGHGSSTVTLLEYLLAFWNGVDLMYRTLENPKIRLHISAIVIGLAPDATPYISNNMIDSETLHQMNSYVASMDFFYAIKESFPLKNYDIAVTMTRLKLSINGMVLGFANIGDSCQNFDNEMHAVAFIMDDGVFKGVHTAAHELGHVIGLKHDNGTTNCVYTDGYIMGFTPWYTKQSSSFSPCSIQALQERLNNQSFTCFYNEPKDFGKDMPKLMPGRMKNLEAQCQSRGFGKPCEEKTADICENFCCFDKHSVTGECKQSGVAALAGTPCEVGIPGPDKFCLNKRCVHL